MIGAVIFFILLFGYYGLIKGDPGSLKVFLVIIGIIAIIMLIGSCSNSNDDLSDADREKIRIYEENHIGK